MGELEDAQAKVKGFHELKAQRIAAGRNYGRGQTPFVPPAPSFKKTNHWGKRGIFFGAIASFVGSAFGAPSVVVGLIFAGGFLFGAVAGRPITHYLDNLHIKGILKAHKGAKRVKKGLSLKTKEIERAGVEEQTVPLFGQPLENSPGESELSALDRAGSTVQSPKEAVVALAPLKLEEIEGGPSMGLVPDEVELREELAGLEDKKNGELLEERVAPSAGPQQNANHLIFDEDVRVKDKEGESKVGFRLRVFAGSQNPVILWSEVKNGVEFGGDRLVLKVVERGRKILEEEGFAGGNPTFVEHQGAEGEGLGESFTEVSFGDSQEEILYEPVTKEIVEELCGDQLLGPKKAPEHDFDLE